MTSLTTENSAETLEKQEKVQEPIVNKVPDAPAENTEAAEVDPNWKAFREARKKDRLEREAAEKKAAEKEAEVAALKAAMEAALSNKGMPNQQAYQQYYGIQNEDQEEDEEVRIEKKVEKILAAKESKLKQEAEEREAREYPNRLNRDFPDISHVCSQENIDYLEYHHPEIARPLGRLNEGYDKWHDIYKAIKKYIPNHSTAHKESIKAEINQMKPKSISSTSITQSGSGAPQSWQEIEQRRAANWERMNRVMKST